MLVLAIIVGFVIAISTFGPANTSILDHGIKSGFKAAMVLSAGELIADAIYISMAVLGLAWLTGFIFYTLGLYLLGAVVLCYLGITGFKSSFKEPKEVKTSRKGLFISGFLINISSPLTILSWLSILSLFLVGGAVFTLADKALYAAALVFGTFINCLVLAVAGKLGNKYMREWTIKIASRICSLIILGFGLFFVYQLIMAI